MSSSSSTAIPDYSKLADQQFQQNLQLNRYNQVNPLGAQSWQQDNNGNWTQVNQLSPNQQTLLSQNENLGQNTNNVALNQLNNVSSALSKGIDPNALPAAPINAGQTAQDAIMSRLQPQFARDQNTLNTQLANQGIGQGTEAWNNAQDQFGRNKNDASIQAGLQGINAGYNARDQGMQEQSWEQNQPINALNSLRSGGQVSMPQFTSQGSISPSDQTGAAQDIFKAQNANNNVSTASNNNTLSGLFGLGSAALQSGFWK
jgi:hypothetical protein